MFRSATPIAMLILLASAATAAGADHAVILQYHHVDDGTPASTSTRPDLFRKHVTHLVEHEFRVAPLGTTLEALRAGRSVPDSTVCLTFDDAWENVAHNAWPLLQNFGFAFTVFVATGQVDAGSGSILGWDRMRDMAAAGVTFAPHSIGHDYLARPVAGESATDRRARLENDITGCLARLRAELGESAVLPIYAYPYGEYDPVMQEVVAALGLIGLGQHSGAAWSGGDFTALPRYPMGGPYGRMEDFELKVASLPLPVVESRPAAMVLSTATATPELRLRLADDGFDPDRLTAFVDGQPVTPVWTDREAGWVTIATPQPLPEGRSRTNVTAPARTGRRWYWYSRPWLRLP